MNDLQTDNATKSETRYTLGPERRSDGVHIALDHLEGTVKLIDLDEGSEIIVSAAEALGLLDVLTHERERLQQWVREGAG